jgi:hypothetical protein
MDLWKISKIFRKKYTESYMVVLTIRWVYIG